MVGIGIGEMILIAGIALVIFGPEKFPDFAKIVLRTVRDLRGYVDDIQKEEAKEITPIKREMEQLSKYDPEKYVNKLAKEVTGEKKPAATPTTPSSTSAADPTDRQDDSFDYNYDAGHDHPDEPQYNNQEMTETPGAASVDASQEQAAETTHAADAASSEEAAATPDKQDNEEKDEFDFSDGPVERLD